jgi:hypothetical protein
LIEYWDIIIIITRFFITEDYSRQRRNYNNNDDDDNHVVGDNNNEQTKEKIFSNSNNRYQGKQCCADAPQKHLSSISYIFLTILFIFNYVLWCNGVMFLGNNYNPNYRGRGGARGGNNYFGKQLWYIWLKICY